jgi:regulatory protein
MKKRRSWRDKPPETDTQKTVSPERMKTRTMERAVRLLAARPRSAGELRARLLEKDWTDAATVDEVLQRLSEYGYLDDEKFAQNYAAYQLRQKSVGRRRLERELRQRKVDAETAEAALDEVFSEVSEDELLDAAIAKRLRAKGRPNTPAEIQNLAAFLFRRGFTGDAVWEKVRTACAAKED